MALDKKAKNDHCFLKDFFKIKTAGNEKSMTYGGWRHEVGLSW